VLIVALVACGPGSDDSDPVPDPPDGGVVVEHIGLSSSTIGQATLIVASDGTSALVDVGNDAHADEVAAAVDRHGLDGAVDHVVLTHLHADHLGAFDALFGPGGPLTVRGSVVWRGYVHTEDANRGEAQEVQELLADLPEVALCDDAGCPGLPHTLTLGDATLTWFLADGWLATDAGVIPLDVPLDDENARSLGGILTLGDFDWVNAGDLTGGGKDTPDVEGAVAARAADVPWVPAGAVDVVVLNHHGISSSTSPAWVDWLLPPAGPSHAVVGATGAYLDAPSEEALEALIPHLGDGKLWVTETGVLGGDDPHQTEAHGSVVITVEPGGAAFSIGCADGTCGVSGVPSAPG
jgi:glyoxylase-like metal-dependent hydrolase (beta-lactamase superfamily II)